jgi:hypothetical protein
LPASVAEEQQQRRHLLHARSNFPFFSRSARRYTGKPVIPDEEEEGVDGLYPIPITQQSHQLEKAMPYMKLGVTAMKATNAVGSVARM